MWRLDSIKYRLLLITALCLAGMLLLVISQIHYANRLIELNQQFRNLQSLESHMLQLRRHEKDFLLRQDNQYFDLFEQRAKDFVSDLEQLMALTQQRQFDQAEFGELAEDFHNYQQRFSSMAELQNRMGLNENLGLQGQFRDTAHALEAQFSRLDATQWQLLLLQLRRHEKDFLLRKDLRYVDQFDQTYLQLSAALAGSKQALESDSIELLKRYQKRFHQLVDARIEMGLNHNVGLMGQFRGAVHQLEARLGNVQSVLLPLISEEEQRVRVNGVIIVAVTAVALLFALFRSFNTFQRAFSNFIMFFYRCKREYQHLDEKQLGFAEFKSLAVVANEMVDARQEMERKLKQAEAELALLRGDLAIHPK